MLMGSLALGSGPKEFKGGAWKLLVPDLVTTLIYGSSGMAEFGGIGVRIHLEFLYRVLAELVGSAP